MRRRDSEEDTRIRVFIMSRRIVAGSWSVPFGLILVFMFNFPGKAFNVVGKFVIKSRHWSNDLIKGLLVFYTKTLLGILNPKKIFHQFH